MDLDDIREILTSYTKELTTFIEERGVESLYEEADVEAFVEEFIASNDDLWETWPEASPEESY